MKRSLICLFLVSALFHVSARGERALTVVYTSRSEVNREVIRYIQLFVRDHRLDYRIVPVLGTNRLKGTEGTVVLLNTGRSSGLDPELESYLARNEGRPGTVLVSILPDRGKLFVEVSHASVHGVDAVTSASTWVEGGLFRRSSHGITRDEVLSMHDEWVAAVFDLLG